MRSVMMFGTLLLCVSGIVWAEEPPAPAEAPKVRYVPDPFWVPKPSDNAFIWSSEGKDTFGATDFYAWVEFSKFVKAIDADGVYQMLEEGKAVELAHLTPILIIAREPRSASCPIAGLEVRIKGGKHNRTRVWIPEGDAVQLLRVDPPSPPKPKPKPKTVKEGTPASIASRAYRDARQLEADGKIVEAIAAYRKLEGSIFPEGKLAAARLRVLTGK